MQWDKTKVSIKPLFHILVAIPLLLFLHNSDAAQYLIWIHTVVGTGGSKRHEKIIVKVTHIMTFTKVYKRALHV